LTDKKGEEVKWEEIETLAQACGVSTQGMYHIFPFSRINRRKLTCARLRSVDTLSVARGTLTEQVLRDVARFGRKPQVTATKFAGVVEDGIFGLIYFLKQNPGTCVVVPSLQLRLQDILDRDMDDLDWSDVGVVWGPQTLVRRPSDRQGGGILTGGWGSPPTKAAKKGEEKTEEKPRGGGMRVAKESMSGAPASEKVRTIERKKRATEAVGPFTLVVPGRDQAVYESKVKACLDANPTRRYFMSLLSLVSRDGTTHANIVIFDKATGILERFDSYQAQLEPFETKQLDAELLTLFTRITGRKDIQMLAPPDLSAVQRQGLQFVAEAEGKQRLSIFDPFTGRTLVAGDPYGYCFPWGFLYIQARFMFPDMDPAFIPERKKVEMSAELEVQLAVAEEQRVKVRDPRLLLYAIALEHLRASIAEYS